MKILIMVMLVMLGKQSHILNSFDKESHVSNDRGNYGKECHFSHSHVRDSNDKACNVVMVMFEIFMFRKVMLEIVMLETVMLAMVMARLVMARLFLL